MHWRMEAVHHWTDRDECKPGAPTAALDMKAEMVERGAAVNTAPPCSAPKVTTCDWPSEAGAEVSPATVFWLKFEFVTARFATDSAATAPPRADTPMAWLSEKLLPERVKAPPEKM